MVKKSLEESFETLIPRLQRVHEAVIGYFSQSLLTNLTASWIVFLLFLLTNSGGSSRQPRQTTSSGALGKTRATRRAHVANPRHSSDPRGKSSPIAEPTWWPAATWHKFATLQRSNSSRQPGPYSITFEAMP